MMTLEGQGFEAIQLPGFIKPVFNELLPVYKRAAAENAPQIRRYGQLAARVAFGKANDLISQQLKNESQSSPPTRWVQDLIDPLLTPFQEGVTAETTKIVKPLLAKTVAGVAGVALLLAGGLFLLGRVTKRCR